LIFIASKLGRICFIQVHFLKEDFFIVSNRQGSSLVELIQTVFIQISFISFNQFTTEELSHSTTSVTIKGNFIPSLQTICIFQERQKSKEEGTSVDIPHLLTVENRLVKMLLQEVFFLLRQVLIHDFFQAF